MELEWRDDRSRKGKGKTKSTPRRAHGGGRGAACSGALAHVQREGGRRAACAGYTAARAAGPRAGWVGPCSCPRVLECFLAVCPTVSERARPTKPYRTQEWKSGIVPLPTRDNGRPLLPRNLLQSVWGISRRAPASKHVGGPFVRSLGHAMSCHAAAGT